MSARAAPGDAGSLDQDTLRALVAGTAAETGERFFDALVEHLARAVGTHAAWVTEWLPAARRLRALSFWAGGRHHAHYEYAVEGTPCAAVVETGRLVHVPDRLLELYAGDPDLPPLGAVSYLGVALLDTDGAVLGHLAVIDQRPLPADPRALAVFDVFAGRAGAELRRLRRERDLRARERKLAGLVESALDAIVELDHDLRVTGANPAAEAVFGRPAGALAGLRLGELLSPAAGGRLAYLAAELARQPDDRQSAWIPDGLVGRRATGAAFPAEGTLSRFTVGDAAFYTLILRDTDQREAAEARIRALTDEAAALRAELDGRRGFEEVLGESPALAAVLADVARVAPLDTTVLITGETGTGKELVARAIHRRSARAGAALVAVNCAAIPSGLQESELFGHEKGAFTGATQRRAGRFQQAHGGTLFLDEVGELPLDLQAKLLRALQEGEVTPVGATRTERVDVRVIAATHRDLAALVAAGTFREDLRYRLDVFPLRVPPLRDRGDDVALLAAAFARDLARQRGLPPPRLTAADRERLRRYDWPGNVRELRNVVERALITSPDGRTLDLDRALPEVAPRQGAAPGPAPGVPRPAPGEVLTDAALRALERDNLLRALEVAGGKVSGPGGAAALLGLKPNTLASRLKALGIARPPRT